MRTRPALLAVSLLAVPLAACVHGAAPAAQRSARPYGLAAVPPGALDASFRRCSAHVEDARAAASADLLVPAQVRDGRDGDMLALVNRYRARWLVTRSSGSAAAPVVYLDGQRLGGGEMLRIVTASSVQFARRLSGPQAHLKYGVNHSEGAIELFTTCTDD